MKFHTARPVDLACRFVPSTTYRWGYITFNDDRICIGGTWFKTRRAAETYAKQFAVRSAIARYTP